MVEQKYVETDWKGGGSTRMMAMAWRMGGGEEAFEEIGGFGVELCVFFC